MKQLPSRVRIVIPSQTDIEAAERMLGVEFADDYRTFLSKNNGVWLPEGKEHVSIPDYNDIDLDSFYDIVQLKEGLPSLVYWNRDYAGSIPPECITIAADVYGNQVLLVCEGSDKGMILLWDHEREGFEEPKTDFYNNVYELAPNLEALVNGIEGIDDDK
jgi:hypothetical protein